MKWRRWVDVELNRQVGLQCRGGGQCCTTGSSAAMGCISIVLRAGCPWRHKLGRSGGQGHGLTVPTKAGKQGETGID